MTNSRKKKPTRAEELLTEVIKGDIRDYNKQERKYHTISLDVALKLVRKALRANKDIFLLISDDDERLHFGGRSIGVATTDEKEAIRFVKKIKTRMFSVI